MLFRSDNTASALFHPVGFPNPVTASGSARVTVIHPSFTVTKTCSTPEVPAGQTAIFTVDVANTGDVPLSMVLSDKLGGAPFALTSTNTTATATSDVSNAGLSFSAGTVSFTLGAGKTAQLEISVTASGTSVHRTSTCRLSASLRSLRKQAVAAESTPDRKSTRLNSSH